MSKSFDECVLARDKYNNSCSRVRESVFHIQTLKRNKQAVVTRRSEELVALEGSFF